MEKAWEKMDWVEKAGKGRSERGNVGMMVDWYLNNQLPVDSVVMSH